MENPVLKDLISGAGTVSYLSIVNDYIDHIDNCLLTGFSDLSEDQLSRMKSIICIFNDTPLKNVLADSLDMLTENAFSKSLFLSIAVIRNALLALKYNVLLGPGNEHPDDGPGDDSFHDEIVKQGNTDPVQESISNWLTELAITGFKNLVEEKCTGILKTMNVIAGKKEMIGQTVLIAGLVDELFKSCMSDTSSIPITRWGDLWMKAFINTKTADMPQKTKKVSGTLFLIGLDLKTNVNVAQLTFYGILECSGRKYFVKIYRTNFKVDLIQDEEIWYLFHDSKTILTCYCQNKSIKCRDVVLTENNDLLLGEDNIKPGKIFHLLKKYKEYFLESTPITGIRGDVFHRHPVLIELPYFLEKIKIRKQVTRLYIELPDITIPVAMNKIDSSSPVNEKSLKPAQSVFGLLRYDAGTWQFQPLAFTTRKEPDMCVFNFSSSAEEVDKITAKSTLSMLKERAGRLLRG